MIMLDTDERVTTQVISLIKKYEKALSEEDSALHKNTLERVVLDLKNELYKYKPSATLDIYEDR